MTILVKKDGFLAVWLRVREVSESDEMTVLLVLRALDKVTKVQKVTILAELVTHRLREQSFCHLLTELSGKRESGSDPPPEE